MGAAKRHHRGAAEVLQLATDDRIVDAVGQDGEALLDQDLGGLERLLVVRVERLRIADHLELDEIGDAQLAREAQRAHGLVGGVAAGGVRQDGPALAEHQAHQRARAAILEIDSAQGHRDHLGPGGDQRLLGFLDALVLAGTDDEPGLEQVRADFQAVLLGHATFVSAAPGARQRQSALQCPGDERLAERRIDSPERVRGPRLLDRQRHADLALFARDGGRARSVETAPSARMCSSPAGATHRQSRQNPEQRLGVRRGRARGRSLLRPLVRVHEREKSALGDLSPNTSSLPRACAAAPRSAPTRP